MEYESSEDNFEEMAGGDKRGAMSFLSRHKMALKFIAITLLVGSILFYFKGMFVVALVNGKPITRLSVIKELERQSGKQAIDSLITQSLVQAALKKAGISVTQEEIAARAKEIEQSLSAQGKTLKDFFAAQGINEQEFSRQVALQKGVEKFLADKTAVSDEEVEKYMKDNKISPPKGVTPDEAKKQLKDDLQRQKFQAEVSKWISELKAEATVRYFVTY